MPLPAIPSFPSWAASLPVEQLGSVIGDTNESDACIQAQTM
jgi:hypothetical protein